jgi:hypothetical protein
MSGFDRPQKITFAEMATWACSYFGGCNSSEPIQPSK